MSADTFVKFPVVQSVYIFRIYHSAKTVSSRLCSLWNLHLFTPYVISWAHKLYNVWITESLLKNSIWTFSTPFTVVSFNMYVRTYQRILTDLRSKGTFSRWRMTPKDRFCGQSLANGLIQHGLLLYSTYFLKCWISVKKIRCVCFLDTYAN